MTARWTKPALAGVKLSVTLRVAAYSGVIDETIHERPPPRTTPPAGVSSELGQHGSIGWKRFDYMTVKGGREYVKAMHGMNPGLFSGLPRVAGLVLSGGVDPSARCGENEDTIAVDLVSPAIRWSIEQCGDCTSRGENFSGRREWGAPMTASHNLAALLESD